MSLPMSVDNNSLFYLSKGQICSENKGGLIDKIKRVFTQMLGFRNYNLSDIVTSSAFSSLSEVDSSYLKQKVIKKLNLPSTLFSDLNHPDRSALKINYSKKKLEELKNILSHSQEHAQLELALKQTFIKSRFEELGLDPAITENDIEGATFLIKSRLLYSICGFRNSTNFESDKHSIKVNQEGKLQILVCGEYEDVSNLKDKFEAKAYESGLKDLKTRSFWNYFGLEGLTPIDRYRTPKLTPITKLSKDEHEMLLKHAQTFYKSPQKTIEGNNRSVIQVFTNPRGIFDSKGNTGFFNKNAAFPVHAAIRLISSEGEVYSTGFGSTSDEDKFNEGLSNFAATINGMPTIMDYEEFRKHEGRIVTSIAISNDKFEKVLKHLNDYREKTIRFNIVRQNCVFLASQALKDAGIPINAKIQSDKYLKLVFSTPLTIKIEKFISKLFAPFSRIRPIKKVTETIEIVPNTAKNFTLNSLLCLLGASKGSPSNSSSAQDEHESGFEGFNTLISSWKDMFKSDAHRLAHSLPFIQWQLKQRSTYVFSYENMPKMQIVPPHADSELNAKNKSLLKKLQIAYLCNFGHKV